MKSIRNVCIGSSFPIQSPKCSRLRQKCHLSHRVSFQSNERFTLYYPKIIQRTQVHSHCASVIVRSSRIAKSSRCEQFAPSKLRTANRWRIRVTFSSARWRGLWSESTIYSTATVVLGVRRVSKTM